MTALIIIEAIVIALLAILVAGLLRSHAEILRRLHALDGGEGRDGSSRLVTRRRQASIPEAITGTTVEGQARAVALVGSRGYVLLAFLSSGCTTCLPFWEAFRAGVEMPAPEVRPVIVTRDQSEQSPTRLLELAPPDIPTIMAPQAWDDFGITVSPYFVLVDAAAGAVVGEGAAGTWDQVRELLRQAMADAGALGGHDTAARARRVDQALDEAGIAPGDPSLYRNPHQEDE